MKRRSVAFAGFALALACAGSARMNAAARSTNESDSGDIPAPLAGWVTDWEAQPLVAEPIAAAYTDDAVYEEVASGVVRSGREEINAYLTEFLAAFADPRAEVESVFAIWAFTGNYVGQRPGLPAGTGQPISFRGASLLDLRDGMIFRETQFFDAYGLLIQVGAVPAQTPPARTSPKAGGPL
jgi:ketosteroid isomerase-like protein